jgi:hypothetical protein
LSICAVEYCVPFTVDVVGSVRQHPNPTVFGTAVVAPFAAVEVLVLMCGHSGSHIIGPMFDVAGPGGGVGNGLVVVGGAEEGVFVGTGRVSDANANSSVGFRVGTWYTEELMVDGV